MADQPRRLDLGVADVHQPGATARARPAPKLDTPERIRRASARLERDKGTMAPEAYATARASLARAERALSPAKKRRKMHLRISHPMHGRLELHLRDDGSALALLSSVALDARGDDAGPRWQQIAKVGIFRGHPAGPFELTPAVFADIVRNFREVDGGQVAFDFEHASELEPTSGSIPADGAPAQGWIRQLDNRGERGLWALVEWLEPARSYIREGKYRHVSPAIRFNAKHPVSGQPIGARLTSVALTNKPFLRGMVPVMATDSDPSTTTGASGANERVLTLSAYTTHEYMPRLRACLKLGELATPRECADALSRVCDLYGAAGDACAMVQGVDLGSYTRPLRDLMNLPLHHTWEEVFKAVRALIEAAIAEHEVEHHSDEEELEPPSSRTGTEIHSMSDANDKTDGARLLRDLNDTNAALTVKLRDADAARASAEQTLAAAQADLNAAQLQVKAHETELVTLRDEVAALRTDAEKRLAADRDAEVAEAIAVHGKAKGIKDADKDALLALLTASPDAFRKLYPKVDPARRTLMSDVSGNRAGEAPRVVVDGNPNAVRTVNGRSLAAQIARSNNISLADAQALVARKKG